MWLDTISHIEDMDDNRAVLILKDGTRLRLKFGFAAYRLFIANADGGTGEVLFSNVTSVRFLKPARKDGDGNAMFDHWRHSPFTGEKLPAQE